MLWVTLPCAAVYCLMLCLLGDSIKAADALDTTLGSSSGDGPMTLFMINSGVMGWASVAVLRKRIGITGKTLFALGLIHWPVAIAGGFIAAWLILGTFSTNAFELGAMCAVFAALAGGFNAFMPEEL